MSTQQFREGDYDVDCTPDALPDGRFGARAVLRRSASSEINEVRPDFEPFATAAEAASAAHTAALAWIAHRDAKN